MSADSKYPLDCQHDDGTTTTDGASSFSASISADGDTVVLWGFNPGQNLINRLSPEGALVLGRALVSEAHVVLAARAESDGAQAEPYASDLAVEGGYR